MVELPDERLAPVHQLGRNVVAQAAADGLNERCFDLLHPERHLCTPFDQPGTPWRAERLGATVDCQPTRSETPRT